jgi:hypothetical protein
MTAQTDQIHAALQQTADASTCDDCLAARAHATSQDVAAVSQRLADHGDLDREQGTCVVCGQAKIVNSLITSRNVPG